MGTIHCSGTSRKTTNDNVRRVVTTILGVVFGFFVGISFPSLYFSKIHLPSSIVLSRDGQLIGGRSRYDRSQSVESAGSGNVTKIYVPTNPHGAELLPPGIIVAESDFYLHRLWGDPSEVRCVRLIKK
uniref:Uncharacterized protein n=1 Tax=Rhizophora mucronata TaxID=61149 RepID=A0A2P2JEU1_RHIMU